MWCNCHLWPRCHLTLNFARLSGAHVQFVRVRLARLVAAARCMQQLMSNKIIAPGIEATSLDLISQLKMSQEKTKKQKKNNNNNKKNRHRKFNLNSSLKPNWLIILGFYSSTERPKKPLNFYRLWEQRCSNVNRLDACVFECCGLLQKKTLSCQK